MKKVYVLIYDEWDGGCGSTSEPIIASADRDKLKRHQEDLESKSETIRDKMVVLEKERETKLQPLWDKYKSIIAKLSPTNATKLDPDERSSLVKRRKALREQMSVIHNWFYEEKNKILNDLDMEYWIDDPELASFNIAELEVI